VFPLGDVDPKRDIIKLMEFMVHHRRFSDL
jgi:hypothetical protein